MLGQIPLENSSYKILPLTISRNIEWPEVDTDEMNIAWQNWRKDREEMEGCRIGAREWRYGEL